MYSAMGSQGSDPHQIGVTGNDIELLSFKNAQLYLVDEDESVPMQCGEFKLVLTKQLHSPLAALVAIVKDVEWPVGRDCPVIKVGKGCYSFCLPGILYGLVLSDCDSKYKQLELFLMEYCTFEDHSDDLGGSDTTTEAAAAAAARDYWNDVANKLEMICTKLAWNDNRMIHDHKKKMGAHLKATTAEAAAAAAAEISPRMMKRVQQARRLSAIAKLFSRALLKGAISNLRHVTNTARSTDGATKHRKKDVESFEAVASVDAFAKVVEAVESAGKSIAALSSDDDNQRTERRTVDYDQHQQQQQRLIETPWTLNKCGLQLLTGAVAASTAMNLSRSGQSLMKQEASRRPPLPFPAVIATSKFVRHGFRPVQQQQQQQQQPDTDSE